MNALILTISTALSTIEDLDQRGLYVDLIRELRNKGVNLYTVSPRQRREHLPTEVLKVNDVNMLKVKTGNITKTKSFIEKGFSMLSIEKQYLKAINRYFKDVEFDMIIYSAPPITLERVIRYLKKKHNSRTYLMLKDIFPQNSVDLGLISEGSLLWRYFRRKEKQLYEISDVIGCMSKGNVDYVLNSNPEIPRDKVEVFPNALQPIPRIPKKTKDTELLRKYGISADSTLFVYGGNLGKPQGIDFLLEVINRFSEVERGYLLIVGSGTEYNRVERHVSNKSLANVKVLSRLPKEEYDKLVSSADVGLVFLDKRFTIPNFPSRLLSYMENSLPILAATDRNTDVKDVLKESKCGFWCESGDLKLYLELAKKLSDDKDLRARMGLDGRIYLENHFDIRKTINVLLRHFPKGESYV